MNYQDSDPQQDITPKTQSQILIAALIDYANGDIEPIRNLDYVWDFQGTTIILRITVTGGNASLIELLKHSHYQQKIPNLSAQKISDILRAACDHPKVIVSKTGDHKRGVKDKKAKTTYSFTLPSADRNSCLEMLQQQPRFKTSESMASYNGELEYEQGESPQSNAEFYLERRGSDDVCTETIQYPGGLLRIKAPKAMGKTSLLLHLLQHVKSRNYRAAYLNLAEVDHETLSTSKLFLPWFCEEVSRELAIRKSAHEIWKALGSPSTKCSKYFTTHLLTKEAPPLLLAIDEVDRLFAHQQCADDFFALLRAWNDKAKRSDGHLWQQLRLAIAYSTEDYIPRNVLVSPFNVGVCVTLGELTTEQVQAIAEHHEVNWEHDDIQRLMELVGGHPYLIQLAVHYGKVHHQTLTQILEAAPTASGIYQDYLLELLVALERSPELKQAFQMVINSETWVDLHPMTIKQLDRLGLITKQGNQVQSRNRLYQEYFQRHLP